MLQYGHAPHPNLLASRQAARLAKFLEQSLRAISGQVACARTALWVFDGVEGSRTLRCLRSHDASDDRVRPAPGGAVDGDAQRLFEALSREGHVLGDVVGRCELLRQPSAREGFSGGRAAPDVQVAAAFSMNGRLLGALVCTHPTAGSGWSQRQVITLTKASASVALSLSRDGEAAFMALLQRPQGVAA